MLSDDKLTVALMTCSSYVREELDEAVDRLLSVLQFKPSRGSVVLLKPNLVSTTTRDHLGCTSPELVTAVARWFLEQGARVKVGDSPAYGSAHLVMRSTGMIAALQGLDVELVNFSRASKILLPCGLTVPVAEEALNCDVLVNLPKVKAHSQLYASLAVKNFFGAVCGWNKALHHVFNGDVGHKFESLLVDLPQLFQSTFTISDGIIAMHKTGPVKGERYPLQVVGAAADPVALDTALMQIIGAKTEKSIIMKECIRRSLPGTDQKNIEYPLANPSQLAVGDFELPAALKPVTFHPFRMAVSGCRRIVSKLR